VQIYEIFDPIFQAVVRPAPDVTACSRHLHRSLGGAAARSRGCANLPTL